jgi:hypothetical protein
MKIEIQNSDPLDILSSTKYVVENSRYVELDPKKIKSTASKVKSRIEKGLETAKDSFGIRSKNIEDNAQLVFMEDSVNFCFWAEKGKPQWQIEWPKGNIIKGGWYNLINCFDRAVANNINVLDANYLLHVNAEESKKIFKGIGGIDIPLVEKRWDNLRESAEVLIKYFDGKFMNAIEQSGFDVIELTKIVIKYFPSFNDAAKYKTKEIRFYKRAQIVSNDLSYLGSLDERFKFKNFDKLTAFADYKLPQILRHEGLMVYSNELADKVDNMELIPAGSEEEIEIRANTIWSVELIRQELNKYSAGEIDNAIWLISQDQSKIEKPYHRTYTIYY